MPEEGSQIQNQPGDLSNSERACFKIKRAQYEGLGFNQFPIQYHEMNKIKNSITWVCILSGKFLLPDRAAR